MEELMKGFMEEFLYSMTLIDCTHFTGVYTWQTRLAGFVY